MGDLSEVRRSRFRGCDLLTVLYEDLYDPGSPSHQIFVIQDHPEVLGVEDCREGFCTIIPSNGKWFVTAKLHKALAAYNKKKRKVSSK